MDPHDENINVLNFPAGKSRDLEWGSIVYVMGYPQGYKMVTQAMVSNPEGSSRDRFITDALYNRGISGSPVLAIRDGIPNLEIVGMATSAMADKLLFTRPPENVSNVVNPEEPYSGELFVDHVHHIKYGVTFNTSIDAIQKFFRKYADELEKYEVNKELLFQ
jgi:hypothetical protein